MQEASKSSFQGASVSPSTGANTLSKRLLPVLQRTESLPGIVMAAGQQVMHSADDQQPLQVQQSHTHPACLRICQAAVPTILFLRLAMLAAGSEQAQCVQPIADVRLHARQP